MIARFNLKNRVRELEEENARLKEMLYNKRHDFDIGMREGIQWAVYNYASNPHDVAQKSSIDYARELEARTK